MSVHGRLSSKLHKARCLHGELHDQFYQDLIKNFSSLEEKDKFYNWYQGLSEVKLPFWDGSYNKVNRIYISTTTINGSIRTGFFGDEYNPENIENRTCPNSDIELPPFGTSLDNDEE